MVGNQPASSWRFVIGGVRLFQFEVPGQFTIGFEKHIAVHKFLAEDGNSQIATHTLGVYPVPITWTGTFYGGTALQRYQKIERLATQLVPTTFEFGPLKYKVDIQKVEGTIKHKLEIDYTISMIVISADNKNKSAPQFKPAANLESELVYVQGSQAFSSIIQPQVVQAPPASVLVLYTDMQNEIQLNTPLSLAPVSKLQKIAAKINIFTMQLSAYVRVLQGTNLNARDNKTLLTAITALNSFVLFGQKLKNINGPNLTTSQVIAEAGTNLFVIARQFYPNADTATAVKLISDANNLRDYFITKQTSLIIPPLATIAQ